MHKSFYKLVLFLYNKGPFLNDFFLFYNEVIHEGLNALWNIYKTIINDFE